MKKRHVAKLKTIRFPKAVKGVVFGVEGVIVRIGQVFVAMGCGIEFTRE